MPLGGPQCLPVSVSVCERLLDYIEDESINTRDVHHGDQGGDPSSFAYWGHHKCHFTRLLTRVCPQSSHRIGWDPGNVSIIVINNSTISAFKSKWIKTFWIGDSWLRGWQCCQDRGLSSRSIDMLQVWPMCLLSVVPGVVQQRVETVTLVMVGLSGASGSVPGSVTRLNLPIKGPNRLEALQLLSIHKLW